jgi:hypothetical protein
MMTVATLPPLVVDEPTYEPARDLALVQAHVTEALRVLQDRQHRLNLRWRYYDGDHPQVWMTEKFRTVFGHLFDNRLHDNYMGLAVDAVVDRLQVTGFVPRGDAPDTDAAAALATWEANELDLEQEELYRHAQVAGAAYLIVWPRPADTGTGQATDPETGAPLWDVIVNDARNVHLVAGSNRRDRRRAVKVWRDAAARCWRATCYYRAEEGPDGMLPAELVRLRTRSLQVGSSTYPTRGDAFMLDPDDSGGLLPDVFGGRLPVIRYATDKAGRSRLDQLLPIQDKLNKLAANKMVTAEFLAWPQRYVLAAGDVNDDELRPSPGSVLLLDPGGETEEGTSAPTRVGEWTAADLANYDDAHRAELDKLFTIARLPRHLMVNPGTSPSGEAVRADEGPFVALVEDAQQLYGASHADLMELLGYRVRPVWADAEVANDEAVAREVLTYVQAGVPLEVALAQVAGWDEELLGRVRELVAASAASALNAGEAALRALDTGADPAELTDRLTIDTTTGTAGASIADEVAGTSLKERVELGVRLVQYGWEPASVQTSLRLPPGLIHTGAVPVTIRPDEEVAADVAATAAAADSDGE